MSSHEDVRNVYRVAMAYPDVGFTVTTPLTGEELIVISTVFVATLPIVPWLFKNPAERKNPYERPDKAVGAIRANRNVTTVSFSFVTGDRIVFSRDDSTFKSLGRPCNTELLVESHSTCIRLRFAREEIKPSKTNLSLGLYLGLIDPMDTKGIASVSNVNIQNATSLVFFLETVTVIL